MIPEYTDEELMMFADAYDFQVSPFSSAQGSLDFVKERISLNRGFLHEVLSIPFDELPLHLEAWHLKSDPSRKWYEACVSIRLRIGR